MADTNNQNSFLDYQGLSLFWDNVKNIIEDNELVTATALTNLDNRVDTLEGLATGQMISITYLELKNLRDASQLVPGKQYRITDYTCTTIQGGTRSAGHVFDIIVTANSESVLNEEARAIQHEGDSYFTNNDLSEWKIWYSLDNDTARFVWADNSASGRGVIYRMIDEFGNDCPYDFKNIQFYRQWSSSNSLWSIISSDTTGKPCYTFSSQGDSSTTSFDDISLDINNYVLGNIIKGYYKLNNSTQTLNNNCFFGYYIIKNTFEDDCYNNTMNYFSRYNTVGCMCHDNIFDYQCSSNILGNVCYNNIFNRLCVCNHFGDFCIENTLGYICGYNSFGNSCSYIKFSYSSTGYVYSYYQNNHFGDGCQYIRLSGDDTGSKTQQVQNYNFAQGTRGTDSAYLTINGKRNREYETYISKDKDGVIKESVIAEKIDKMINISYNDLVSLRTNSKLIPGQQYRITDYTCTTLEADTQSAGHVFDIIVTADSENKLNEEARAIQHTEDNTDYFANSNLSAWKIWYCLDNDTSRFKWACKEGQYIQFMSNGQYFNAIYTGSKVIDNTTYYLWYNEEFSYYYAGEESYYIGTTTMSPTSKDYYDIIFDDGDPYIENNQYSDGLSRIDIAEDGKGVIFRMIDEFNNDIPYDFKNIQFKHPHDTTTYPYYYYTFSSYNTLNNTDYSLSISNDCYLNTIKPYIYGPLSLQHINKILFIGSRCYSNSFGNNCANNSFLDDCNKNCFGDDCMNNKFGSGCFKNSFGNSCSSNSFGYYCEYNSFGNDCNNNKFGKYCRSNSFGNSCSYNDFGLTTMSSFGGDNFSRNSFGNSCWYNVFGNCCVSNSFGNNCIYIKFASTISAATKYTYYKNNHFGNECQYILFTGVETGSKTQQVQNYNFAQGLQGTSSTYLTIDGVRNRIFETKVAKNSNGDLKIYCEADLVA